MLFKGIGRTFSTENDHQFETIGAFCDECPDFPCADVMEKENRYGSKYPLCESPLENLYVIREAGVAAFLERERRQWTCPDCEDIICVHTGVCSGCGRQHNGSMNR